MADIAGIIDQIRLKLGEGDAEIINYFPLLTSWFQADCYTKKLNDLKQCMEHYDFGDAGKVPDELLQEIA